MPFYAVAQGVRVGIYQTWLECEQQVKGFSGAKFKKFNTRIEAETFIAQVPPLAVKNEPAVGNNLKSEQYLGKKYGVDIKGFSYAVKTNGVLKNKAPTKIKTENKNPDDYIPLKSLNENKSVMKQEVKSESDETCLLFAEDTEGDQELLLALSALQEYPDKETNTRNGRKRKASEDQAATSMPITKHIKIGHYNFTMDNEGFVDAYITGHCENNNNWNCIAGYGVYFGDNHPLNCSKAATGRITSNVGDIEASIHAIKSALEVGVEKLCIHTGSEFLLNVVTSWMFSWKRKGWRNQSGKVVQNRKELQELDGLLANDNISVKWVRIPQCLETDASGTTIG